MTKLDEQRLQRLTEAGRALVSHLELDVVLEHLLATAAELTEARHAALARTGENEPPDAGLSVPIRIGAELFGNLYVTEKAGGRDFSDEDEASLVILAGWAAIAIENARLYQSAAERSGDLERAVRGLEVTTAITRAVGGETDIDRVLELIVTRARALVQARGLTIMLAEGDDLVVAAIAGEVDEQLRGLRVPNEGTVASDVMRSGKPERISRETVRPTLALSRLGIDLTSALVVPLVFRSEVLGVLTAIDRLEGGPQFNSDDEELMLFFAASAATAVHTARSVGEERLRLAIEGAELERRRWARELHDETLQGLGSLQLLLSSALRQPDAERRELAVRSTLEHVTREIDNLRALITELRPAELDELGLESAIESLVHRRVQTSGLRVVMDINLGNGRAGAPRRLDAPIENTLYRLVQEALSNAAKHADAERVDVRLTALPGSIELVVADDGRGFNPAQTTDGFGLLGMRERVALVRGTFELDSVEFAGTTLRVVVPLPDEAG